LDPKLGQAKELQKSEKMRKAKRRRDKDFPRSPYSPERDDEMVRPTEEDKDDPADMKKVDKGDKKADAKADAKKDEDEKKDRDFLPFLGGPKPKEDPRFANKKRPV